MKEPKLYIFIKKIRTVFLAVLLLAVSMNLVAQDPLTGYVIVRGVVVEGRDPLNRAVIKLFEGSKLVNEKTTMPNGKFMFKLNLNKEYLLSFSKYGYVKKKISFITDVPEEEEKNGIWEYKFSIELFEIIEGLDISILDKPISKIKYYERSADFDYDDDYTKSMRRALQQLMEEAEILKNSEYNNIIKEADQLYTEEKYDEAIDKYDEAIDINPYNEYPDQKIYEISLYLRKKDAIDEKYKRAITEADKNFNIQNYEPALTYYKKALALKSIEEYPQNQINTIEKLLQEMSAEDGSTKEKDKQYRNAILDGDFAFNKKQYDIAREKYLIASNLKPNELYPKEQIIYIDNLIVEKLIKEASKEELEKVYLEAITEADEYFNLSNYMEAYTMYERALSFKPEEKYPKDRISEINKIFQTQKAIDAKYNQHIAEADNYYNTEQYIKAKELYKQALSVKPNEQYPKDQIVLIDSYLASLESIEESYNDLIAYADELFNKQEYLNAKSSYNEAIQLKPDAEYPKNQITEIDKILLAQKNVEATEQLLIEQYNNIIAKADQLFESKDYNGSRVSYEMALNLKLEELYPKQKITEIDRIIEQKKQLRKQYDKLIANADKKFDSKEYIEAKPVYTEALTILPDEKYPKTKLAEIDLKLKALMTADELRKTKEREYNNYVSAGDSLFQMAEYSASKAQFESALTVKPKEKYPRTKIQEILTELDKINKLNQEYNNIIVAADSYFNTSNFQDAKENYEKAIQLKPEEKYPKDKLAETVQKIAEYEKLQADKKGLKEQYNNYIETADNAFKQKDYNLAKTNYQSALELKQNETYPTNKIKEIDDIIYDKNQIKIAYNVEIEKADNYFTSGEYEYARTYYEKALTVISTEQYPKDKLNEIDALLAELKQKRKSYDKVISNADKDFNEQEWTNAKTNYELALTYLPNEQYPQTKTTEINRILDDIRFADDKLRADKEGYDKAISRADAKFNAGQYIDARTDYQNALNYKPDESYPKSKLFEIDDLLAQQEKEKETAYNRAIATADSYLFQKKYAAARSQYNKALEAFPDEEYPKLKLKEIEGLIAQKELEKKQQEELEKLYTETISKANKFFKNVDYVSAKASYHKALTYKPEATFPKKRITEIDELIRLQQLADLEKSELDRQKKLDESKSSFVKDKDFDYSGEERKKDFLSELARVYPEGKTVERYNKPNKKILRIILNEDGIAKEYIKVQYSYGTFYFRNGQNISQGIFNAETRD